MFNIKHKIRCVNHTTQAKNRIYHIEKTNGKKGKYNKTKTNYSTKSFQNTKRSFGIRHNYNTKNPGSKQLNRENNPVNDQKPSCEPDSQ